VFEYYRNHFVCESVTSTNRFVNYVVKVVVNYLRVLIAKNKLFLPFDLNVYDTAIDLSADILELNEKRFVKFDNFFSKIRADFTSEDEFEQCLKGFIITSAQRNLQKLYAHADPFTYKLIRKLSSIITDNGYYVSIFLSDRYIHRIEINFEEKECFPREELITRILSQRVKATTSLNDFLDLIFDIADSQDLYIKAIGFYDIVFIYRYFVFINNYSPNDGNEIEKDLNYRFMFDEIKQKFYRKISGYFKKKNFSEFHKECMYNVLDGFLNNLLEGGVRQSPSELTKMFFPSEDYESYKNKVEYCIQLLLSDIMNKITSTKKIG